VATLTPSQIPFPFIIRDSVRFTANFANNNGCNWQGIGGQVLNANGQPFQGATLQVRAFNENGSFETTAPIGFNSFYGQQTGWEIRTGNAAEAALFFVQLESPTGTQISPLYQLQFPGNCEGNVAIVNFIQQPGFGT